MNHKDETGLLAILFERFKEGVKGAIPNETKVKKIAGEEGDYHKLGTVGIIKGSIKAPSMTDYGYFVEFDSDNENITFIVGSKLEEVKND